MSYSALLVGASGLVGRALLDSLLADDDYKSVTCLNRRPIEITNKKYKEVIVDFDNLEKDKAKIKADHVFCTLGTTIKKAGSQEKFRLVDLEYPLAVARLALANGAKTYSIVTAIGASSKSSIFYSRTKGEVEDTLKAMGFESLHIYQPSFLAGERPESRTGEEIGIAAVKALSFLMQGPLKTYRAIDDVVVANVMRENAKRNLKGVHTFPSGKIQDLYDQR